MADAAQTDRPRAAKTDAKVLAELIGQKLRTGLDPADPIFMAAMIFEELQKKSLAEMGGVVTGLADQVATASVVAENSAKAKAEAIISQSATWGAERLRAAAEEAGNRAAGPVLAALDGVTRATHTATIAAWVACAAAATSITVAAVLLYFRY